MNTEDLFEIEEQEEEDNPVETLKSLSDDQIYDTVFDDDGTVGVGKSSGKASLLERSDPLMTESDQPEINIDEPQAEAIDDYWVVAYDDRTSEPTGFMVLSPLSSLRIGDCVSRITIDFNDDTIVLGHDITSSAHYDALEIVSAERANEILLDAESATSAHNQPLELDAPSRLVREQIDMTFPVSDVSSYEFSNWYRATENGNIASPDIYVQDEHLSVVFGTDELQVSAENTIIDATGEHAELDPCTINEIHLVDDEDVPDAVREAEAETIITDDGEQSFEANDLVWVNDVLEQHGNESCECEGECDE